MSGSQATALRALLRKELAVLFGSPIAYVVLTMVTFVTAFVFFEQSVINAGVKKAHLFETLKLVCVWIKPVIDFSIDTIHATIIASSLWIFKS